MPLQTLKSSWSTAVALLLITATPVIAEEGVVRISDADNQPGVFRMASTSPNESPVQQTSYAATPHHLQQISASQFGCDACGPGMYGGYVGGCGPYGCDMGMCDYGSACSCGDACGTDGCCTEGCCNSGRCRGRRNRKGDCDSFGECHEQRMLTLFAKPLPKDPCGGRGQLRRWRGHQMNYLNRNQRLANHLFGWLVPSGCGGQGCPPIGKYCVNYADDPGYAHPQDGQAWGAQGYGVPVTVPLAPNVRHSYNYSWGTPASRITPMGNYSGSVASHQPLYHQSW